MQIVKKCNRLFLNIALEVWNFLWVCKSFLRCKRQDVRLSAQLAEITGLSGMICELGDPTVGSRSRWDTGGNPVDYACMASLLYDRVKSSPLWQSLYSLSSNAFGRKIFCPLFLIIRAFHVRTALTLSNNFVSTVIKLLSMREYNCSKNI